MAALKELVSAGVRVFYCLEDKERTIDSPIETAIMALETFGAELERAKASQRSTDKAVQLLRAGHVTGGRVSGYDNVRVDSHTERRINRPRPPSCGASSSSRPPARGRSGSPSS